MSEKKSTLVSKLNELQSRYNQITEQISDPEIASNPDKLIPLTKEQGKLKSIVNQYEEYQNAVQGIKESKELLESESDEDMLSLVESELQQLTAKSEKMLKQLEYELVMADDKSVNSIIIEIRSGTGGDEASLFARDLYDMYTRYAESRKWKVETISFAATEMGGIREVVLGIKGRGIFSELGYESGGHRVQRVPKTESQGRVHTSAATVVVLPEPEEVDIQISPNEVEEHVSRSSGPGGQSVNKLNSAIKLEHKPTGITVSMQDEKSQHKNRSKAWRILRTRVYEHFESQKRQERDSKRKSMIGSGDRSQKIRTYNFPQNRLTDHRINLTLYSLDKIIAGDLSEVVKALQKHDIEERIKNL
jgi:peptide chain release factor 1